MGKLSAVLKQGRNLVDGNPMPERPGEHEIDERAVSAVRKAFEDNRFTVSEVSSDYGEGLLVQTNHEGRMDASRLWVQVKGTDDVRRHRHSKKSKRGFSLSVPLDTAMRWIRTIDLVIVVLWDVEREAGWYAVPRRQVDDWSGLMSGQESVALDFGKSAGGPSSKGKFDTKVACRLGWESRFEHLRMLTLSALDVTKEEERRSPDGPEEQRKLALIMAEFLRLLGLTDPEHTEAGEIMIKRETRERAVELYKALLYAEQDEPSKDFGAQIRLVAGRVILERLAEIDPDLGMPVALLGPTSQALALALGLARYYEEFPDELKPAGA